MRAGGGAGGNGGTAHGAVFEINVDFNGRIAAAVEDFARDDIGNGSHGLSLGNGTDIFRRLS
ncbi:hypothetical protein D3C78_1772090 [compost metagenome]